MPWTTAFCIVGSLAISGFPLFSGFVTKSMTLSAAAETHVVWVTLALLVASAGVVDHSGIKIPFFAFFAHDSGRRVPEAPLNMRIAMGIAALLCLVIGLYPAPLYAILPYPVDYAPYTGDHVLTSLQLLLFAALAFAVMWRTKLYPPELKATNLDSDWIYRHLAPRAVALVARVSNFALDTARGTVRVVGGRGLGVLRRAHEPPGLLGEPWSTSATSLWAAVLLALCLVLYYV
jgi:multicomponent Na+:H+ antiporter subunit D